MHFMSSLHFICRDYMIRYTSRYERSQLNKKYQSQCISCILCSGADPGFRRVCFVHSEGGVSYIQKGGFRTGISGANLNCCRALGKSTSKTKLQTAIGGGGGFRSPPKKTCIRAWCCTANLGRMLDFTSCH